tara:strand:- start:239 stop:517 length:279 start_codon:yes stop_codon:yes gene_type:complete
VSSEHQERAIKRLEVLQKRLDSQPNAEELTELVEECGLLLNAVKAFHMEAIRFYVHGIRRKLTLGKISILPDCLEVFEDACSALNAAGFKTK